MPQQVLNDCLPRLCLLLTHPYRAVRHMAARCMGTLACLSSVPVMTHVVDKVLPLLGAVDSDIQRQGAVEVLTLISDKLQFSIVPYIVMLVVPLLGKWESRTICSSALCHTLWCLWRHYWVSESFCFWRRLVLLREKLEQVVLFPHIWVNTEGSIIRSVAPPPCALYFLLRAWIMQAHNAVWGICVYVLRTGIIKNTNIIRIEHNNIKDTHRWPTFNLYPYLHTDNLVVVM